MKKVLTLVVISIILWGCSGKTPEIKRIPLTTTSPEAERLFREVLINNEHGRSYLNTNLFNQINKLDPTFVFVKLFEKWPPNPENLQYVLERSDSISDYERRFAKIITEMTKANMIGALEYIKKLIDDYPDFYETREFASIVFTYALDVEGAQAQLSKAIELNPQSFNAHMKLAQLHFDKGGGSGTKDNEIMLPIEKRDLDYAERLIATPGIRCKDSARFVSGNLPISSAKIASIIPELSRLRAVAAFIVDNMPVTTISSIASDCAQTPPDISAVATPTDSIDFLKSCGLIPS